MIKSNWQILEIYLLTRDLSTFSLFNSLFKQINETLCLKSLYEQICH